MKLSNKNMSQQYSLYKNTISEELWSHPELPVERQLWHGTKASRLFSSMKFIDTDFGKLQE